MRDAATNGSFVAYLDVADVTGAFRQQRTNLFEQVRRFKLVMRGHRSDAYLTIFFADIREVLDAGDIDKHGRHREA